MRIREIRQIADSWRKVREWHQEEHAVTTVEYAVMLMLIVGACIILIQSIGSDVSGIWDTNSTQIDAVVTNNN